MSNLFSPQINFISVAPESHSFYAFPKPEKYQNAFKNAWKRNIKILRSSLPSGILLKVFEDRMDLMSVMITGPPDTPYDGCLFFFDVHLPLKYPSHPPKIRYIKFHNEPTQIHPNIFFDGSICLSLLNNTVQKTKNYSMYWMSGKSTLLQVFVSLQGVLAKDPVNNIAYKASAIERTKEFNRTILSNVIRSMTLQMSNPMEMFKEETLNHYRTTGMTTFNKVQEYTKRYVASGTSSQKRLKVPHSHYRFRYHKIWLRISLNS